MGNPVVTLGVNGGVIQGLNVTRTVIAAQTTPVSVKLGQGNLYGVMAYASGTAAAFVQYFTHGGTTLGVSAPHFELPVINGTTAVAGASAQFVSPVGIPFAGTATTSGIWVAAGVAASTGTNVAADTVIVYTIWA